MSTVKRGLLRAVTGGAVSLGMAAATLPVVSAHAPGHELDGHHVPPQSKSGNAIGQGVAGSQSVKFSGVLPNGNRFRLPPVGQPPFPVPAQATGLAGGKPLSGNLDPTPAYVPQSSCDIDPKPGVAAFRDLVLKKYPQSRDWGISRNCTDDGISEHLEGRAWDWNADVNNASQFVAAGEFLTWLTANNGYNAKRLGVMYIGYNYRIWGAYRASEGWRALSGNPHTDHVHFSFSWNGALKRTSFWTGSARSEDYGPCRLYSGQPAPLHGTAHRTSPCPAAISLPTALRAYTLLWRGSQSPAVADIQRRLSVTPVTGFFGASTFAAVRGYQQSNRLPVTGAVDATTSHFLAGQPPVPTPAVSKPAVPPPSAKKAKGLRMGDSGPAVLRLQQALGMAKKNQTGYFGPKTRKKVKQYKRAQGLKANGIAGPKVLKLLRVGTSQQSNPARAASPRGLSLGDQGSQVVRLQQALGMAKKNQTGYFGPKTRKKVKQYKRAQGLKANGIAGPKVLKLLRIA